MQRQQEQVRAKLSEEGSEGKNGTMNVLFSAPASKTNCIIGCIAEKTTAMCNCWPPELPFVYTGDDNATEVSLKWCDWREKPQTDRWKEKPNHLTWFQWCFSAHEDECNKKCKPDCR